MVTFDANTHTYTNEHGEKYISVSTLLGEYKKPFDKEFFSRITAKKRGVSQDVVLKEWEQNTKNACDFGKVVHSIIEDYIKSGIIKDAEIVDAFKKVFIKKYVTIHSERILFSDKDKIAGTSDMIVDVNSDTFDVYDLKTNTKFDFDNKYNEYLLKPVHHLQNCKYNTYALQLSLYAYLYSLETGKKPRRLAIFYWDKKDFQVYNVPYMYWETVVLLKHYNNS